MKMLKGMLFRFAVVLSCVCIAVPVFDFLTGCGIVEIDIMLLEIVAVSILSALGDYIIRDLLIKDSDESCLARSKKTGQNKKKSALSKRTEYLKLLLHYIYINVMVIGFGCLVGWFDIHNPIEIIVIFFVIMFIYAINVLATYIRVASLSNKINERLAEVNKNED